MRSYGTRPTRPGRPFPDVPRTDAPGLPPWSVVRVAVTMEQSWHRVPGGTAVAALAVARALAARPDGPEQVGVAARHGAPAPAPWTPPVPVRHLPLPRIALYEAWSRLPFPPVELATGRVDVVHATTIIPAASRAPQVVTVHDLAFLHEPEHFTPHGRRLFARCVRRLRRRADLVLCSSSATLDDCLHAGLPADRLRLVLLGVDRPPEPDADTVAAVRARHGLHAPYLVFNGTLEPRKNLPRLLDAFAALVASGDPAVPAGLRLALAGAIGWGDTLRPPAAVADRVDVLGFVPEADLPALFAGALVCCQPSLREGFGLPVLQAMAVGTPVVTSRGTSTEEVAGGAAVLVDPTDTESITAGIVTALGDGERARLAVAGRARAAELTWDRTADATLAAYRELAP